MLKLFCNAWRGKLIDVASTVVYFDKDGFSEDLSAKHHIYYFLLSNNSCVVPAERILFPDELDKQVSIVKNESFTEKEGWKPGKSRRRLSDFDLEQKKNEKKIRLDEFLKQRKQEEEDKKRLDEDKKEEVFKGKESVEVVKEIVKVGEGIVEEEELVKEELEEEVKVEENQIVEEFVEKKDEIDNNNVFVPEKLVSLKKKMPKGKLPKKPSRNL